jgi:hypothetical protein
MPLQNDGARVGACVGLCVDGGSVPLGDKDGAGAEVGCTDDGNSVGSVVGNNDGAIVGDSDGQTAQVAGHDTAIKQLHEVNCSTGPLAKESHGAPPIR